MAKRFGTFRGRCQGLCAPLLERNGVILRTVTGPKSPSADWQRFSRLPLSQFLLVLRLDRHDLTVLSLRSTPHCLEYLTIARLFPDSIAYLAIRAFCSGGTLGTGHAKARSRHPSRWSRMRGEQIPFCWHLGPGRDLDLTEKYCYNAMIASEHWDNVSSQYNTIRD